jgi:MFS family permease
MSAELGLRKNWKQFSLLVLINAFVGATIGMERSIFPDFANEIFGLESHTAMLSFIMAFGLSKAVMNYFSGRFSNRLGRKNLLLLGWLFVLPVPFILNFTGSWIWVICSNLLLGFSQGLTWSSTVVMKIDLVGEKNRGFAMGLNEFAGYLAVGLAAVFSAYLASTYGIRPVPFGVMGGIALIGFTLSVFTQDTKKFILAEASPQDTQKSQGLFWETTLKNKALSSVTQAGLVNNLNDGMIWGLLPVLLISRSFDLEEIGKIASVYPIFWGVGQLFTGKLGDHISTKKILFWGMFAQSLAIMGLVFSIDRFDFIGLSVVMGLGTALVYPTFLTAIANASHPVQRAENLGVFRFWRDMGYALGALISGIVADRYGIEISILFVALLTLASAMIIKFRMPG